MSTSEFAGGRRSALILSIATVVVTIAAGWVFWSMHEAEPIVAGPGVTAQKMLSEFEPSLAGSAGDTPVFELAGTAPGGTIMVLGGTHPQEIAGMMAAVLVIENVRVKRGKIVVVPQSNRSGFTHTDPMEAYLHSYEIDTPGGKRWFRVGMRLGNPVHQWPDPDIYVHQPSGEGMVGHEARNLNRLHPGRANGWLTARVSHGLTAIARTANVVFDMHEAQPEYPVINMFVVHQKAFELVATANAMMQGRRIPIGMAASPLNLHGLSHREFGDHTNALSVLAETANPAMGRFRGRTSEELVVEGRDDNYVRAAGLGRLFVKFDAQGWPLKLRVARHLAAIEEIINAYNELNPATPVEFENFPQYKDVVDRGLGAFLRPPPKS